MQEVDFEFFRGKGSRYDAYTEVMRRRSAPPEPFQDQPEGEQEEEADDFDDLTPEEKGTFFNEFLEDLGLDADMLPPDIYRSMRADFERTISGEEEEAFPKPPPPHFKKPVGNESIDVRIKERYRWLVRQLHPDTCKETRPDLLKIWHEVQEAYQARNLEQLETLVAVVEMREGVIGEQTSLSQARAALRKLQAGLNAINKSLNHARKDIAWLFSRAGENERQKIGLKIEPGMRAEIKFNQEELAELDEMLRMWAIPPRQARRRQAAKRKRPPQSSELKQPSFEF